MNQQQIVPFQKNICYSKIGCLNYLSDILNNTSNELETRYKFRNNHARVPRGFSIYSSKTLKLKYNKIPSEQDNEIQLSLTLPTKRSLELIATNKSEEFDQEFLHTLDRMSIVSTIDKKDNISTNYINLNINDENFEYVSEITPYRNDQAKCIYVSQDLFDASQKLVFEAMRKTDFKHRIKDYEKGLKKDTLKRFFKQFLPKLK